MKKLTAAQTKSITNAKDQVKAAANVMIETQRQGGEGGPTNPASPSDVVAALRRHEWVRIMQEAADLIEQQAERIKELEAERDGWREDANVSRNSIAMLKDRCNHFEDTLAALRKRIDDAHVHDKRFRMTFSGVQEISLICREDLK